MAAVTTTALIASIATLTKTAVGVSASFPPAAPVAAALLLVGVFGEVFKKVWNKKRQQIPNVISNLASAIKSGTDTGVKIDNYLKTFKLKIAELEKKQELIKQVLGKEIPLQKLMSETNDFQSKLYDQVVSWITTAALAQIAKTDNTFYTLNKNNIDALIDAYTSGKEHVIVTTEFADAIIKALDETISTINEEYNTAVYVITTVTIPPTVTIPLPGITIPNITLDDEEKLIGIGSLVEQLRRLLSVTRTVNKKWKKKKRRKKKIKKYKKKMDRKKKKFKPPQKFKRAWINTSSKSRWISKVIFEFPIQKDIDSDDKGSIYFHLKKSSTVIKFVRVKRGTFSRISQAYGTGYRIWSQFWKKRIVNRTVLSWFIKRIDAGDRVVAIQEEINDRKVRYK